MGIKMTKFVVPSGIDIGTKVKIARHVIFLSPLLLSRSCTISNRSYRTGMRKMDVVKTNVRPHRVSAKIRDSQEIENVVFELASREKTSRTFLSCIRAKTWKIDGAKLLRRRRSLSKKLDPTYMAFVKFADTKFHHEAISRCQALLVKSSVCSCTKRSHPLFVRRHDREEERNVTSINLIGSISLINPRPMLSSFLQLLFIIIISKRYFSFAIIIPITFDTSIYEF